MIDLDEIKDRSEGRGSSGPDEGEMEMIYTECEEYGQSYLHDAGRKL